MIYDTNEFQLPLEIDLLFENKKLDTLKYLGILYNIKKNTKKRAITPEQLLYYFSFIYIEEEQSTTPMINKYIRDEKNLNKNIIFLNNLGFVDVKGDITTLNKKLKLTITDYALEKVASWNSEYIMKYFQKIELIITEYPYEDISPKFKQFLYEGEFSDENQ